MLDSDKISRVKGWGNEGREDMKLHVRDKVKILNRALKETPHSEGNFLRK